MKHRRAVAELLRDTLRRLGPHGEMWAANGRNRKPWNAGQLLLIVCNGCAAQHYAIVALADVVAPGWDPRYGPLLAVFDWHKREGLAFADVRAAFLSAIERTTAKPSAEAAE